MTRRQITQGAERLEQIWESEGCMASNGYDFGRDVEDRLGTRR